MIKHKKILFSTLFGSLLITKAFELNVRRTQQVLGDPGCTYVESEIEYEQGKMPSGPGKMDSCILPNGKLVEIQGLPNEFKSSRKGKSLTSGKTTIRIVGNSANIADGVLTVPANAQIVTESTTSVMTTTLGVKKVLVIRAQALDSATTSNIDTLKDEIFGTSGDQMNLKSQYDACSYGDLTFEAYSSDDGISVTGGVGEVNININVNGEANSVVRQEMLDAADVKYGISTLVNDGTIDHVMLCLPPGTSGSWIAYAYINSWLSVYNDRWCEYPSGQMHEIGHNLGLAHSGETATYDDQSGMMGYSYGIDEGPVMCFNAPKNWQLGWYSDDRLSINTLESGSFSDRIIGLSDYGSITSEKVMIQVTGYDVDYYVSFNRMSGINSGTRESGNQVLVHSRAQGTDYSESKLLAKLNAGGSYTISGVDGNTVINVNSIVISSTPAYADITITGPNLPTPPPTNTPVSPPTSAPTVTPPTPSPTNAPVSPPTSAPTVTPPTPSPTDAPVSPPTSAPTVSPPTPFPTDAPVSPPTNSPTVSPPVPECTADSECDNGDYCNTCINGQCMVSSTCSTCGRTEVKVDINTDNYGYETSYEITNSAGSTLMSGRGYNANTDNSESKCFDNGSYTFTINDSYGDGVCCSYGSGSYSVKLDNAEVASGGTFGASESTSFDVTGPRPPECASDIECDDGDSCTTDTCDNGICTAILACNSCGKYEVKVDITTDRYGYETSYEITNSVGSALMSGSGYSSSTDYSESNCLDTGSYIFTISDSWGDGICCAYGNGSYSVKVDNVEVASGAAFGTSESTSFGTNGSSNSAPGTLVVASTVDPPRSCSTRRKKCKEHKDCCHGRCNLKKNTCKK